MKEKHYKKLGNRSELYSLCVKIECGQCGAAYVGSTGTSKTRTAHHYYTCLNRRKHHTCDAKNLNCSEIEDLVISKTIEILSSPIPIEKLSNFAVQDANDPTEDTKK